MLQRQTIGQDDPNQDQKQRRMGGRRSRNGCSTCKSRHLKCDERVPICNRCMRAGLKCFRPSGDAAPQEDPTRSAIRRPLNVHSTWTQAESLAFNHFVGDISPCIGEELDNAFWRRAVLPGALDQDSMFKPIIALTRLYDIPLEQIRLVNKPSVSVAIPEAYKLATRWYAQGLRLSLQVPQAQLSIGPLLLGCVLYSFNEKRLGHFNQVSVLMTSIFALMASSQELRNSKDSFTLASMVQLLSMCALGFVDSTHIPRHHRTIAMEQTLRISSSFGTDEALLLRMELISVLWDMEDSYLTDYDRNACDVIELRWTNWRAKARIWEQQTGQRLCLLPWQVHQVQWQVHQFGLFEGRILLEHCLEALLRDQEICMTVISTDNADVTQPFILDMNIGPSIVFIAWYWRTDATFERIKALFSRYPSQRAFAWHLLNYVKVLTMTNYDQMTAMEADLFTVKIKVFKKWHAFQCVSRLAEMRPSDVGKE